VLSLKGLDNAALPTCPAACANCHIMRDHCDAWTRASHRAVATCNDCHTPAGMIPKHVTDARNGFWHSFYFHLGGDPDPFRITPRNSQVTIDYLRQRHIAVRMPV
jgi:cytochrome c nitrite reductase small subunit